MSIEVRFPDGPERRPGGLPRRPRRLHLLHPRHPGLGYDLPDPRRPRHDPPRPRLGTGLLTALPRTTRSAGGGNGPQALLLRRAVPRGRDRSPRADGQDHVTPQLLGHGNIRRPGLTGPRHCAGVRRAWPRGRRGRARVVPYGVADGPADGGRYRRRPGGGGVRGEHAGTVRVPGGSRIRLGARGDPISSAGDRRGQHVHRGDRTKAPGSHFTGRGTDESGPGGRGALDGARHDL